MLSLFVGIAVGQTLSNYHGFVRHDFKCAGTDAIVVAPKVPAKGNPWIWRTEFFDHRPELDLALLAKGFHLVHLVVGNTFGAPGPMGQFGEFYHELTGPKWKLNRRVVMEGFSRGGLYAYNWAFRNANKVMAIYGDAPVCDFTTWPYGGRGGQRSDKDWKQLIDIYGFPNENAALEYPFQPINCLDILAMAKIPIIHVVGSADEAVPVSENTDKVEAAYRKLGGTIEVIRKPGGLHHPHSLDDPTPLVRFLLAHQDDSVRAPLATMIPAPNLESRYNAAGWNGRSWVDQASDGARAAARPEAKLVLLGDSITQGFGGFERQVGAPGGVSREKWLDKYGFANLGISGERVQNVLWRVRHGALKGTKAKVVLIMIGINNHTDDSPSEVVQGIANLYQETRKAAPQSIVLVQSPFPTGKSPNDPLRQWTEKVHSGLNALAHKVRIVFDPWPSMLNADGTQKAELFASDGLHLSPAGYEIWAQEIDRALKPLLSK